MIILDTSFIISYEVEDDINHDKAKALYHSKIKGETFGKAVITDYIFDESVTAAFNRTKSLKKAVMVGENLMRSAHMLKVDDLIFDGSWRRFQSQNSTKLSFTDCTILTAMELYGIERIATFDKDFSKVSGVKVLDS